MKETGIEERVEKKIWEEGRKKWENGKLKDGRCWDAKIRRDGRKGGWNKWGGIKETGGGSGEVE
jgi:hypothetical protein